MGGLKVRARKPICAIKCRKQIFDEPLADHVFLPAYPSLGAITTDLRHHLSTVSTIDHIAIGFTFSVVSSTNFNHTVTDRIGNYRTLMI